MADVVVDANVLVGFLDEHDSLFAQASAPLANNTWDNGTVVPPG